MTGQIISHYRILDKLGEGGMGVVYKAEDLKLRRDVAIKILPQQLAENRERFLREAQAAAALNHPNICTVFEIDEEHWLIAMEFIDGESVQEKIARRPMPLDESLDIAIQASQGLAAAHQKGVVHRDIKSSNLMMTSNGHVKLMDFGLAQVSDRTRLTKTGLTIGTPAYMSPEQAQGRPTDRRTDLWSLGVVLYEMVAGRLPFAGETDAALTYAIVHTDPEPLTALRSGVPMDLDRVVAKCLAKNPDERYQHIDEALVDLRALRKQLPVMTGRQTTLQPVAAAPARRAWLPWTLLGIATTAFVITTLFWHRASEPTPEAPSLQFVMDAPADTRLVNPAGTAAISPDGSYIVFSAAAPGERPSLWLRQLSSLNARQLPGTQDTWGPFWSPDGRSLGFFAAGKLKTIEISGGPPVDLCNASLGLGGSWAPDGTIVFAPASASPLFRVSASGGEPVQVTSLNATREEAGHNSPQFLPDNRHFLFHASSVSAQFSGIYLGSLDGGDPKLLLRGVSNALFVPPDHILFVQNGELTARSFDPSHNEFSGESVTIVQPPDTNQVRSLSASRNGILAFVAGESTAATQLEWFNRAGDPEGTVGRPGIYYIPRLSPDGAKIAVGVAPPGSPTRDIWIFDQAQHTERRLTFDQLHNAMPVWSPDGTKLAYTSNPKGKFDIYVTPADGSGATEPLLEDDANEYVDSWSSDGKYLAYARENPGGESGWDIWALPLFGDKKPFPVVQSQSNKEDPTFSPDGKWLAYDSDETGNWEVYIVPFPSGEGKMQATTGGGRQPRWRRDGRELFFLTTENKLMAAEVREDGASLEIGNPQSLFQIDRGSVWRIYDVTDDGNRFIVNNQPGEPQPGTITVIDNWPALLGKK